MKCFNHVDTDATATCQGCGKGLCTPCAKRFEEILCEPCLQRHNKAVEKEMYRGLAITGAILVLLTVLFGEPLGGSATGYLKSALFGLISSFTYWGWKFLNRYWPDRQSGDAEHLAAVATIPSVGFIAMFIFLIKFMVAYVIGFVVGPYQIYKMAKELRAVKETRARIADGTM